MRLKTAQCSMSEFLVYGVLQVPLNQNIPTDYEVYLDSKRKVDLNVLKSLKLLVAGYL